MIPSWTKNISTRLILRVFSACAMPRTSLQHLAWKSACCSPGRAEDSLQASHQMVDALLMVSMWKSAVIRGIAVMHDGSRIARGGPNCTAAAPNASDVCKG